MKAGQGRLDVFSVLGHGGVNGAFPATAHVVAKGEKDSTTSRIAANEMLGMSLARTLGLPCPPGGLVTPVPEMESDKRPWFYSLAFTDDGESINPVVAEQFCQRHQALACGIFAFDAWIWNPDRHAKNLRWAEGLDPVIWDHEQAFGGSLRPVQLHPAGSAPPTTRHCLTQHLGDVKAFGQWTSKIDHLASSPYLAAPLDGLVAAKLLRRTEAAAIEKWLRYRGRQLPGILNGMLPHLEWGLSL